MRHPIINKKGENCFNFDAWTADRKNIAEHKTEMSKDIAIAYQLTNQIQDITTYELAN